MRIKGAQIYTSGHRFENLDILIKGGRIIPDNEDITVMSNQTVINATGLIAIPGLVDTHIHGAYGVDFSMADEAEIEKAAVYEAEHGISVIYPTSMTISEENLENMMKRFASYTADKSHEGAIIPGLHMEGPFLSKIHRGSQDADLMRTPDIRLYRHMQKLSGGLISCIVISPDLPGSMEFISELNREVKISIGHTDADYETASEAFRNGASRITHLYNGMPGIHHRAPGPIISALEFGAEAELIADGVHVHPAMVRLAFKLFPADKIILVSDSIMGTGLTGGCCTLGGRDIFMDGDLAVLVNDRQTIAGSITNLFDCMKKAVQEMGIPLEVAVRAASENPARALGIDKDYGSLMPGHVADILLLDKNLNLKYVIQRGRIIATYATEV